MTTAGANRWVVVSAVVVGGIYGYQTIQGSPQTTVGQFITAWGVIFFILALIATGAPGLAGSMAILIMTADLLANIPALATMIQSAEGNTGAIPGTGKGSKAGQATKVPAATGPHVGATTR